MYFTVYHTQYFAHELTKRCSSDSVEKLAGALVDAQVDLNPHQVEAALFAFRSPLSKGALLADEVGLGKTIEAGLVLSQKWAERKQQILVITPANLRKQWYQELTEKFFLPCAILESKSYNDAVKQGISRPFDSSKTIIICSYQFARSKEKDVRSISWDLVVIDEAHRLRNVYKPSNVIANTLKTALASKHKILLTATPLQNSLLELYGLTSFIDEHVFGDLKSFREQYSSIHQKQTFQALQSRLKTICQRTLRRQVLPYVRYTKRLPLIQEFTPEESEDRLYNLVSDYLRRDNLQALPASQRSLMTLVLRKLLASSTFAIAGALGTMGNRLREKLKSSESERSIEEELDEDYESLDETAEEWPEDSTDIITQADRIAIENEIADLEEFKKLALSIEHNAKGESLLLALERAFKEADRLGASLKAIIFTESRRTQDYLLRVLSDSPYAEGIVLFNGSNSDERSKKIYKEWFERCQGTDCVTGSRTADIRSALVDYFREQGRIMIATEAAAEGINLQFCSLVVNYDLPWNPQRIEQRIGRCHRYGQKHDVVVVNFLNRNNEADQYVYRLLSEKFQLFEGVFGASDEVLGAIESGVDFEKRIADIYQRCRHPDEIQSAFEQLQRELSSQIDVAMTRARQQLLENFDEEVTEKLRVQDQKSKKYLNRFERMLMQLTQYELNGFAKIENDSSFILNDNPFPGQDIPLGLYELPRRSGDAHLYRMTHPLASAILDRAKSRDLPPKEIQFHYSDHEGKVTNLEPFMGKSGWLSLTLLSVESLDQVEDHLLVAAITDEGEPLEEDSAKRLLRIPGYEKDSVSPESFFVERLEQFTANRRSKIQNDISERNMQFYSAEADKLDNWADDVKTGLEREIKELDRQIKEARRVSKVAPTLEEKLAGQKQIKTLESQRNLKRRSLFDAQDDVDKQRDELIALIEGKLTQKTNQSILFTIRWILR